MTDKKPAKNASARTSVGRAKSRKDTGLFSAEERAAMRDHVKEMKRVKRPGAAQEDDEGVVLAKLATMPAEDRAMGERLHAIIKGAAPQLTSRLWYGMPAYAKDGAVICFFQNARKFKTRYATLGFSDKARLDDGNMWPAAFAVKALTAADEARIVALVKRAVG